ncbi:MAG: DUF4173 domain-containing protein [Candidatus Uhrbacteria bacterium]|nr:DUF4173 domain-containing protein [Candidatus Uhrbacteria bacterium]
MKHLPWKLLLAALILGVLFDILIYDIPGVGINILLMQIIFIGATAGIASYLKQCIPTRAWVAAGYALAFAFTFAIWTSSIGLTLSGIGFFVANLFFILNVFGHHGRFRHPLHIISTGFLHIVGDTLARLSILSHLKIPGVNQKRSSALKGMVIAVPVVLIFLALFLSSDLLLQEQTNVLTDWIADFLRSGQIIGHAIVIVFFTGAFLLFFATAFWKRIESFSIQALVAKFGVESSIILGSTSLLFFAFLLFQGVYLFGGKATWENIEAITYSEYAVHGFNQLAFVAFLVLALILTLRYLHGEHASKFIRALEVTLITETILVIASAWIRMDLYTDIYAYTPARLFGFWFFITTGVVLIMLMVNIIRKKEQTTYVRNALLVTGALIFIFSASSPDALSVRLNNARNIDDTPFELLGFYRTLSPEAIPAVHAVLQSKDFQNYYLPEFGIDACGGIVNFTKDDNYFYRLDALDDDSIRQVDLRRGVRQLYDAWAVQIDTHSAWQSWNLSSNAAKNAIDNYVPADVCGNIITD